MFSLNSANLLSSIFSQPVVRCTKMSKEVPFAVTSVFATITGSVLFLLIRHAVIFCPCTQLPQGGKCRVYTTNQRSGEEGRASNFDLGRTQPVQQITTNAQSLSSTSTSSDPTSSSSVAQALNLVPLSFAEARKTFQPCTRNSQEQSSRPGVACLPPAMHYPYEHETRWRVQLGERVRSAVSPTSEREATWLKQQCGGFRLFGDSSWCKRALPVVPASKTRKVVGLSFGIEERDLWSEKMSNWFHVPTMLFDCYQNPAQSPALRGSAPNATGQHGCKEDGPHCYEAAYWPHQICLGVSGDRTTGNNNGNGLEAETTTESSGGATGASSSQAGSSAGSSLSKLTSATLPTFRYGSEGRKFSTLEGIMTSGYIPATLGYANHDLGELSIYLKIDIEGSEWGILENLVRNRKMHRKIRTLDMEIHFGLSRDPGSARLGEKRRVEREIAILESLRQVFYVTGSTLEVYREGWHPAKDCQARNCPEPLVHLAGGMSVGALAVSYVNKRLLDHGDS
ncbi:unnamed protein product [Amoebophrya sp. A25]|nr:unnamed protein product [Amoebophrya sp. A25]|eukprot:GSA25T00018278001.1